MLTNIEAAKQVATIAAKYTGLVDLENRFPTEAVEGLKSFRLLSLAKNFELDSQELLPQILSVCTILGQACPSTAMIFAMHTLCVIQISVHGGKWHETYLDELEDRQNLIASATSEVEVGGATAISHCAKSSVGEDFTIYKRSSVMSYGQEADAILVTARRSDDALGNQQILALCRKESCISKVIKRWDAMGMRGTCSHAFELTLSGKEDQVFRESFGTILASTGIPTTHLLWGHVWLGIATGAYEKARKYVRGRHLKSQDNSSAKKELFECMSRIISLENDLLSARELYLRNRIEGCDSESRKYVLIMNSLKTRSADSAISIVQKAMDICGLAGYLNGNDHSIAQAYRDILSSRYMINNRRIEENMSELCLVTPNLY